MKKIILWIFALFAFSQMHAQLWTINSCYNGGSNLYGPMNSTTTANANSRFAAIYPAADLTTIIGQNLNAMYFERFTASGTMAGTPNFKIYLKEVSATDWGSGSIDWATETTGATLVYDSNPATIVGSSAGWKSFPFLTNFLYSGTQNLAVFTEYYNSTASVSISWKYESLSPCIDTGNSNTSKYNNNTTGTLASSLTTSNYRRPLIGFDFAVTCNAPSALMSSNITTSSADISWTENATQPQNGYEYYYSTSSTTPTPTQTPSGSTATGVASVSLSSLSTATVYYMWVRGNCGPSDKSVWSGPISFTTLCVEVAEFTENFETSATGVGNLPVCWDKFGTSNNVYTNTGSLAPMSPANRLYMNISTTTTAFAMMPPVSNLQANTHRLKFKSYATTTGKELRLGYFAIQNDPTSFVLLNQFQIPGTTVAETEEFTYLPTGVPTGISQLVFNLVEGVTTAIYIDDVIWEAIPNCPEPNLLVANDIMSTSALLGWTNNGTETAWEIEYGLSGFVQGSGTLISANTNPFTINSLLSNTDYDFYVRAVCSSSESSIWTGPFTFKTACAEVTEFIENFDTSPTGSGNLPDCWSKLGTTTTVYNTTGSVAPMSPANKLYMTITATTTAFAVMPPVSNLQANTHRLKFKAYCTTPDKYIKVGYLSTPGDESSFVSIQSFQMPGSTVSTTQEYTVIPTNIPVGVNQLVFGLEPGVSTVVYIDDVKWEVNSSCTEPSALTASALTNNSATLGWTLGGLETQWDIEYGPIGFSLGSGVLVSSITSNPYVLGSLTSSTTYDYYVRAVCTGSVVSAWVGPFSFTTQCDDFTEFTETFEGYPTGTTSLLPDCWGELNIGTGNSYITTGANAPMSPANRLYMTASGTTPTETCAILPSVSNLQANTHRLRFKAYSSSGTDRFIAVGYLTDPSDTNSFIQIQEVNLPGTTLALTQEFTIVPGSLPAGVKYLAFKNAGHPSGTTVAYIDDVIWEAIPSCVNPDINSIAVNSVTNNTATIQWVESGTATQWEIEYGVTGFTPGTGTIISVATNPFTLNSLTQGTNYEFYIRSVCGAAEFSPWTGPSAFLTQCDDVTEFSENFDTYATGTANPLPDCWSKLGNGLTYLTTGANSPMSPANRLYMSASGTTPTVSIAVMPSVSNLQANTHRLRFRSHASTLNKTLEVGYLTNSLDLTSFVQIQEVSLPGTTVTTSQEFTIVPGALPAGVKNLCFRNIGTSAGTTTLYIDDVIWEAIPSCVNPDINSIAVNSITNNTAIIQWVESGTATQWEIEYGVTGFTPGTGTIISVATNPFTLNSLTSGTNYEFYIRSVCGAADFSPWTGPSAFQTECDDVTEFSENFEGYSTGSTNPLPNCWSKLGNGLTYITTGANSPMSPANRLYMSANGTTPTVSIAVMPSVSNLQANTHRLRFRSHASTLNKTLEVGYLTNSLDLTSFVQIQEVSLPGTTVTTSQEFTIVPGALPAGVKNLCFRNIGTSAGTTSLYIDDVIWEAINVCPQPTALTATNITANSADFGWTENGSATTWNIEYGPVGFTQGTGGTLVSNVTTNPYTLSSLNSASTYDYYVQSSCGSDVSLWSGPYTFTPLLANDSFDIKNFIAYPNPVNDIFNLSYSSEITSIKVVNLLGQELLSKNVSNNSTQIDMTSLSAGTYIVNVVIDDVVKSIKIVKK